MRIKPEWTHLKVGEPSTRPDWVNVDCSPLETVYHICHVREAFRVFEDGKLRSSLVSDQGRLKEGRTCVVWVSPNRWAAGSMFGNIRFVFDWRKLVQDRHLFWVGAVQHYSITAFRILVTDKREPLLRLPAYDPARKSGPLYHNIGTDKWYWNGDLTGQFMIDANLDLDECSWVSFVDHNADKCKTHSTGCADLGKKAVPAGATLLAALVGNRIPNGKNLFCEPRKRPKRFHREARKAWNHLIGDVLIRGDGKGSVKSSDPVAPYLATAIFARAGRGGEKGLKRLCALFRDDFELRAALLQRARSHFGLTSLSRGPL